MSRLVVAVVTITLCACGAARPQPDEKTQALSKRLNTLQDSYRAQHNKLESLKDRLELLEDRLEAQTLHAPRASVAVIPPGLPTIRLQPEDAPAPPTRAAGPVATITQRDLEALDGPRRRARGGPRLPVSPPANASRAGNIGVVPLPGATTGISKPATAPVVPTEGPVAAYKAARAAHRAGDLVVAIRKYRDFAARNPRHDFADNAVLGLGQCRYARAELAAALKAFRWVIQHHPTGNVVPEALLMVGLTQWKLGRRAEARETLSRLVAMFPATKAGRHAAAELQKRRR